MAKKPVRRKNPKRPAKKTSAIKKNRRKVAAKKKLEPKEYFHQPPLSEEELIGPLNEDLRDAWAKLKEHALSLGEQRVYTSAKAIMFSRRICHFFVRPKRNYLELTLLLAGKVDHELVNKTMQPTKEKTAHVIKITHADHIEEPLTDWLRDAYALSL